MSCKTRDQHYIQEWGTTVHAARHCTKRTKQLYSSSITKAGGMLEFVKAGGMLESINALTLYTGRSQCPKMLQVTMSKI